MRKTAAAKKYIEKTQSSDEEESLADLKRTSRSKRTSLVKNSQKNARESSSRASSSRSTRNSTINDKSNEKNGASDVNSSSESESGNKSTAVLNRKRKSSINTANEKKAKPSTSSAESKSKHTENKPKNAGPSKKKKGGEERYEVEAILDHKFEDNLKYFLIRWKGYDKNTDSWESQYSISCPALLTKYYEENPEASISAKRSKKRKKIIPKLRQLKIDQQLDYSSDWDENEDYEVGRILDVYIHRNGKREFLIRWKGYSADSDSWEPEENLDCNDLIEKFMSKVEHLKNVSQKDLRPIRSQTQRFTLMTQASARRLSKRNIGRQRAVYHDCDE